MPDLGDLATGFYSFIGGSVGATAAIAFLANHYASKAAEKHKATLNEELEKLKNDLSKEAETHKLSLKKQELIFNKELEAASEFMRFHRKIRPTYSHPDMDWDDACEDVVQRLGSIETDLENFIIMHGSVITQIARDMLNECITTASHYKFAAIEEQQLVSEAKKHAGELLIKLTKVEELLILAIRD
jgi:hypothetical protein